MNLLRCIGSYWWAYYFLFKWRDPALDWKLAGKVGGAFATSGVLGGGSETTVLDIVKALLVHGMIIAGDTNTPCGAVAIGKPNTKAKGTCKELGKRISHLVKRLS